MMTKIIGNWIKTFDQCWIPDTTESPPVSGILSESVPLRNNTYRIGLLSRLNQSILEKDLNDEIPTADILIILSGPEPHRSQLEKHIVQHFKNDAFKVILVQGKPELNAIHNQIGKVTLIPHCTDSHLYHLMIKSALIICRSGYSTIMDLFAIDRKAILIPTPGQYEQEYLAQHLTQNFGFTSIRQNELTLKNFHLPKLSAQKNNIKLSCFFSQLPQLP
ncbi:MAG: hypothetical protein JEZ14_10245 [Marinilabiliaceae bacterium]|nr:hypothetical protein [Marinilabiliaceae bacterium]